MIFVSLWLCPQGLWGERGVEVVERGIDEIRISDASKSWLYIIADFGMPLNLQMAGLSCGFRDATKFTDGHCIENLAHFKN